MKKLSALSLLFVMTLAWLAPRANAQEYEITLPTDISDWHKLFTNPDRFYLQAAVIDDHFYTVPAVHNSSQMVLTYYTIGYDFISLGAKEQKPRETRDFLFFLGEGTFSKRLEQS
jgi:hypothetical protein